MTPIRYPRLGERVEMAIRESQLSGGDPDSERLEVFPSVVLGAEGEVLELAAPLRHRHLRFPRPEAEVEVRFAAEGRFYASHARVLANLLTPPERVRVRLEPPEPVYRRSVVRWPLHLPVTVLPLSPAVQQATRMGLSSEGLRVVPKPETGPRWQGQTLDVSAGGLFCRLRPYGRGETAERIPLVTGDTYRVLLDLLPEERMSGSGSGRQAEMKELDAAARLVRAAPSEQEPGAWEAAFAFLELSPGQEQAIMRRIFADQRRLRRQGFI